MLHDAFSSAPEQRREKSAVMTARWHYPNTDAYQHAHTLRHLYTISHRGGPLLRALGEESVAVMQDSWSFLLLVLRFFVDYLYMVYHIHSTTLLEPTQVIINSIVFYEPYIRTVLQQSIGNAKASIHFGFKTPR